MTPPLRPPDPVSPPGPASPPDPGIPADRQALLATALHLSITSVAIGVVLGTLSVAVGLLDHSLGVLGTGLGVLADVAGSVVLIWRFRVERSRPHHGDRVEARAAVLVSCALGLIGFVLTIESVRALADGTHPGSSPLSLVAAGLAVLLLPPLAYRKRQTATALPSRALRGDSTLSAIGAATALLALVGLLLFRAFDWWWADRVVALLVAGVAALESYSLAAGHGD